MDWTTPMTQLHHEAEAEFTTFPPAVAVHRDDMPAVEVVATFGDAAAEYAALTLGAGLVDLPSQSALTVVGGDRIGFLNQMLTQNLNDLAPGRCVRSFWLNRQGRIEADLRVINLPDRALLLGDRADCQRTLETLPAFIVTEDVELRDETGALHQMALIGPDALEILSRAATGAGDSALRDLPRGGAVEREVAGVPTVVVFDTSLGAPRCELTTPWDGALRVYQRLLETGFSLGGASSERFGAVGWGAFNTRRIEAGAPMARLDFGRSSLPHETGALRDRVSFTKGCYLGQEIVARLESLGHPKQRLAMLHLDEKSEAPALGDPLFPAGDTDADGVGVVTSAVASPLRDGAPTIFAQVRFDHSAAKSTLRTKTGDLAVIQHDFSIDKSSGEPH